jgi:PIN domain nuclease of toxin-antitoxin system
MTDSRVLIDSHFLIWLLYEPEKLGSKARNLVEEAEAVYLSIISLWELRA